MKRRQTTTTRRRPAGPEHAVLTVEGGAGAYRRTPCPECPWRRENAGSFPAEAFRHSANTAYDGAFHQFACHMAGADRPQTCAGFLLQNAEHNIGARLAQAHGQLDMSSVHDGGAVLFGSYREMAVANGVDPEDPRLRPCRANDE
jgi:hypothetical protein